MQSLQRGEREQESRAHAHDDPVCCIGVLGVRRRAGILSIKIEFERRVGHSHDYELRRRVKEIFRSRRPNPHPDSSHRRPTLTADQEQIRYYTGCTSLVPVDTDRYRMRSTCCGDNCRPFPASWLILKISSVRGSAVFINYKTVSVHFAMPRSGKQRQIWNPAPTNL